MIPEIVFAVVAIIIMVLALIASAKGTIATSSYERLVIIGILVYGLSVLHSIKQELKISNSTFFAPCGTEEVWCRHHIKDKK